MKKKISIIICLVLILINIISIKSEAAVPIDSAYIYATKKTDALLMWNGLRIHTHMAVYKKDGKEYPAYCMNRDLPGVEIGFSQTVDVNKLVSDVKVWRAIVYGYPYKTISELGCKTEEEAYLATKQAVYCMLTNRDVNEYTAIGEAGERTLKALKQIVTNARNSNTTKVSAELKINQENSLWQVDSIDKNYVSQKFTVSANASFDEYLVQLKNLNIEGVKITDKNNNEKKEFKANEEFKILIPIINITQDGTFTINVNGKVATKPVFYGESRDAGLQNYALTGYTYEDGDGSKKVYYPKNDTKIVIIKKDNTEKNNLEGVEFELLDQNREVLHSGLTTDKEGKIEIENLLPGIYYIRETKTLEGYQLYNKLIKVELELNEEVTINVINSEQEPNIEIEDKKTELTVKESRDELTVKESIEESSIKESIVETTIRLPKTGM